MGFISDLLVNISAFRIKIGEKLVTLANRIGILSNLTTTNKTNLVSAINEVKAGGFSTVSLNKTSSSGVRVSIAQNNGTILDSPYLTSWVVIDTRSLSINTNASISFIPTSSEVLLDQGITGLFHQDWGGLGWGSSLIMKGWKSGYKAWMISGPATNATTEEDLFIRTSNGATGEWYSPRKVWTDRNFNPSTKADVTEINNIYDQLSAKANTRLYNVVNDLSETEKTTILTKIGATNNVGTVTFVGMSVPLGFVVANSPITTSGTFNLTFASGYSLPTTAKQQQWDSAYSGFLTLGNYVLQTSLNTQLANYVTANGVQTIYQTKTFASSPIVPNATLNGHAVNLGQLDIMLSNLDFAVTDLSNVEYLQDADSEVLNQKIQSFRDAELMFDYPVNDSNVPAFPLKSEIYLFISGYGDVYIPEGKFNGQRIHFTYRGPGHNSHTLRGNFLIWEAMDFINAIPNAGYIVNLELIFSEQFHAWIILKNY